MTLDKALQAQGSVNLNALRLVLAAAVIVSHAWPLALGPGTAEPLATATGHSLGGWAVLLFFFLSGLLVSGSAERRGARAFWSARARRILPGLVAALLVTLGLALVSGASSNVAGSAIWFIRAATLVSVEHRIAGAFAANPYPEVVNGPLWSLFHEVAAYGLCFLVVMARVTRRPAAMVTLLLLSCLLAAAGDMLPGRIATFAPLFAAFAFGMAAHVFRRRLVLHSGAAIVCLLGAVALPTPCAVAAIGYASLAVALRAPALRHDADLSYGLYIYGWPVAQTIVHLRPGITPAELAVLSFACTLLVAALSWHLVERPGIRRAWAAL
jgi:peptidoglycan/LPS O-acetylase OafA/YrhL